MATHQYSCVLDFGDTNDSVEKKKGKKNAAETEQEKLDGKIAKDTQKFFKTVIVGTVVVGTAKWQASLVGRNMGSSLVQEKIDAGLQIATTVGGFVAAAATGNYVAAAAIAVGTGLNMIKQVEQYNYNARWENINLSLSRERLGSSAAINRSRNV